MDNYKFLKVIKIMVCVGAGIVIFSYLVMLLWNWLIPGIFNGHSINIYQAFGILILSKILFSGFGGGRCRCHNGKREFWRKKFEEKMQRMTPEEKARFKSKLGNWYGCHQDQTPSSSQTQQ